MSWELIDGDGLTETWSYIAPDGRHMIVERQNDTPLLEHNANLRAMDANPKSDLKPIASIPITLARKWIQEDGLNEADFWTWPTRDQNKFFKRKYLSSEYQMLRTTPEKQTRIYWNETDYKTVAQDNADHKRADQFATMVANAANDNFKVANDN